MFAFSVYSPLKSEELPIVDPLIITLTPGKVVFDFFSVIVPLTEIFCASEIKEKHKNMSKHICFFTFLKFSFFF